MLDAKYLRNNLDKVAEQLARRGYELDIQQLAEFETERKVIQAKTQELQAFRKSKSKEIGMAKKNGEDASEILAAVASIGDELKTMEARLKVLLEETNAMLMTIPNVPHESTPDGKNEDDNVEVRKWGDHPLFDFDIKDHVDLGSELGDGWNRHGGLMDFETGAKLSAVMSLQIQSRRPVNCLPQLVSFVRISLKKNNKNLSSNKKHRIIVLNRRKKDRMLI